MAARLILNYKSIPYTTQWLEYPDVAPTLESFDIQPNAEGTAYTIPAIRLGSDTYIMDSKKIAEALEKRYPSPPLHLDSPQQKKIEESWPKVMLALRGDIHPQIPSMLNKPSEEYFHRTRTERFGMPLSQLQKEFGGDKAWQEAKPAILQVAEVLKAEGGPFVLGQTGQFQSLHTRRGLWSLRYKFSLLCGLYSGRRVVFPQAN